MIEKESASVVIVENQPLMLTALSTALSADGMTVLAEVEQGKQVLEVAKRLTPDLILFSISYPDMDDLQSISSLRKEVPTSLILAIVSGELDGQDQTVLDYGAHGVLTRVTPRSELLGVIKEMLQEKT